MDRPDVPPEVLAWLENPVFLEDACDRLAHADSVVRTVHSPRRDGRTRATYRDAVANARAAAMASAIFDGSLPPACARSLLPPPFPPHA